MPENESSWSKNLNQQTEAGAGPEKSGARPQPISGSPKAFDPAGADIPLYLGRLLQAFPYLKRHPHPFLVHFSIVFIYAATFLSLLFLVFGSAPLEITAFYCVGAGLLFLPPVMLTGEISRRVNYPHEPKKLFDIEIHYSWVLLGLWAGAFLWRWLDPTILQNFRWFSLAYLLLLCGGVVIVTMISYYGGLLTFPLDKKSS